MSADTVLVINSGSSSLKFGLFVPGENGEEAALMEGAANAIGRSDGSLILRDGTGKVIHSEAVSIDSQPEALAHALKRLRELKLPDPRAIGHRVVHGGPHLLDHQRITPRVLKTLADSVHFAPLHIPPALKLIEEAGRAYPDTLQVACFDTTFHRTMPEAATHLPLPADFWTEGVRRYGFHGLSYESIVHALGAHVPSRLIVAHLGNGCSVAAIQDGMSVDTSMGFTPTGGLVMATRTGDLDPGVLLFLMRSKGMSADRLESLVNHEGGLSALAGHSDVRDVEAAADQGDAAASMALEVFYRSIAKTIAAYASVLGGADSLVFTGGIGEHSARTRQQVSRRLKFLGVQPEGAELPGPVAVCSMTSQEELQIARHTRAIQTTTRTT